MPSHTANMLSFFLPTKYLIFFKIRFCFVSIIIIYELYVVFFVSVTLQVLTFLAPETLLGMQKIVRQWDWINSPAILPMSIVHSFSLLFCFLYIFFDITKSDSPY